MGLYKKMCMGAVVILATAALLSACRAEISGDMTSQANQATGPGSAYNSTATAGKNENDSTTKSKDETAPSTTGEAAVKKEESRAQKTTTASTSTLTHTTNAPTTAAKPQYNEWTYQSATGTQVTYTENPGNSYIMKVSEQRGVPVSHLSATYNSKGATVFLFSSSAKNEESLTDCFIILSGEGTIKEDIQKDGSTGSNKALADILYNNAMKQKP